MIILSLVHPNGRQYTEIDFPTRKLFIEFTQWYRATFNESIHGLIINTFEGCDDV